MSEPEVLLRVPGDRQYALAIRTALGGVAILKDLDADTLDDLRMAADEMCDCLLHQGRTVDHLEVAVYDEGDYLKVAISACYGEKKCPCEDETEDDPRRFADPRQRRGDDPLRRLRAVHYAAAAQGDCAAEKAMTRPEADDLFREYARSRDHAVMARLVEENLPLSQAVARKFQGQGVEKDDLEQVAAMALMQAIERFDPERGLQFSTFALPTIAGSVRNYLRDRGSTIRMTRSLREQLTKLRRVSDELTRKLQREPSMRELAEAMELPPEELLTLLDARRAAQTVSLDAETSDEAEAPRLETFLGRLDEGYEQVEQAQWLNWVYGQVTPTEKLLLQKRFEERLGQRETARALGVSQMQVSRMERRLLTRLREKMTAAVQ